MTLRPLTEPADGTPEVIASGTELHSWLDILAGGHGPVAVDAERASGFRYGQRAYLIQLRREGAGTALIDPLALPDLSALNDVLAGSEWVLHAANQDLPCLQEVQLQPPALFDTELAGRLLGREKVGLGTMVETELGLSLAKEHSAADWSTRPLPESWLRYAALDVEVLIDLRHVLEAELRQAGKLQWALQEFEAVRTAEPPPARPDPWRRTSGTHQVRDLRGLAIVRELWLTRDAEAADADIAPGRVLPDRAIVAAAQAKPTSRSQLATLAPFRARGARRRLTQWAQAVQRALDLPDADLPSHRSPQQRDSLPQPRAWKDRNPGAAVRLDAVRPTIRALADELGLPQENLLSPEHQRRISWTPPADLSADSLAAALSELGARPWQVEQVSARLSEALRSGAPVGVADSARTPEGAEG